MVMVRTRFQPREELEVGDSEAGVLRAQGLLWEGTETELQQLLTADPVGPLDPRQRFDAMPTIESPDTAVPMPPAAAAPVKAKES